MEEKIAKAHMKGEPMTHERMLQMFQKDIGIVGSLVALIATEPEVQGAIADALLRVYEKKYSKIQTVKEDGI